MRIFITGSTGFMGKVLVNELSKEHEVIALVRDLDKSRNFPKNVKIVKGNIFDINILREATKDVDIVFHLAGVIHPVNVDDSFYYDNNVKGTENIVKASSENKVKHFIYSGSVTAYGIVDDESQFIKEDYPCYGQNIYGRTKYEAELVIKRFCKIPYTILRIAKVFGKGDLGTLLVYKLVKYGVFFNFGGGKQTMMPVFIEDLMNALKKSMLNKNAYGKVYNIAGKDVLTKERFMRIIAKKLGVKLHLIYLPIIPTLLGARVVEFLSKLVNKEPFVSRKRLKFFLLSRKYSIKVAKQDLDWEPKKDIEKGIEEVIQWYKENNYL